MSLKNQLHLLNAERLRALSVEDVYAGMQLTMNCLWNLYQ